MIRFDSFCFLIIFEEQERNDFEDKVLETVKHFVGSIFKVF